MAYCWHAQWHRSNIGFLFSLFPTGEARRDRETEQGCPGSPGRQSRGRAAAGRPASGERDCQLRLSIAPTSRLPRARPARLRFALCHYFLTRSKTGGRSRTASCPHFEQGERRGETASCLPSGSSRSRGQYCLSSRYSHFGNVTHSPHRFFEF